MASLLLQAVGADAPLPDPTVFPLPSSLDAWIGLHPLPGALIGLATLLIVSWLSDVVARRYILRVVSRVVIRTTFTWDDVLLKHRVFRRLAHVVPALVIYFGLPWVPGLSGALESLGQRVAASVLVIVIVVSINAVLTALNEIYSQNPEAKDRPIKGYLQVVTIFVYLVGIVLVASQLFDRSPVVFLSGLGAVTAIILLIFRDTILSLVASIQISTNDMVRLGDWIEMPRFGADGDVIDLALHTVTVQNWDKTITTIPTHSLISDSFKNWRGMSESGGRRIKRAIHLDMGSVRFLSEGEVEQFGRWELLAGYIAAKVGELEQGVTEGELPPGVIPHPRRLTNVGTFRAYIVEYLRRHAEMHEGMTLLVRQLEPAPDGLPMEVYVFSSDTDWIAYEGIQSDLFDHLLSVLPEFGLRVFQQPTGADVRTLQQLDTGAKEPLT